MPEIKDDDMLAPSEMDHTKEINKESPNKTSVFNDLKMTLQGKEHKQNGSPKKSKNMSIVINRNHTVHIKLDNFTYDKKTDTIVVKNEKEFSQELQLGAGDTQPKSRSKKIKELRKKTLDKIKEELKPKQRERCNSVRKRSEEEEEADENKPPKSQKQSLSPKKVSQKQSL